MFGIGSTELLVILVVALLVLGPEQLPKIMRTVGKSMADFRRISTEFQRTINTEAALDEEKQKKQAEKAARPKKKKRPAPTPEDQASADAKQDSEVIVTTAEASGSENVTIQEKTGDAQA